MKQKVYEVQGIIHLHSKYSDGSGDVPDIMKDAQNQNLDFVLFTDHNTLKPKKDGWEGWYGKSLAVFGCELNDKNDQNHLLTFGVDEINHKNKSASEYVHEVISKNGICFLAHPHEKRNHFPEYKPYPWTDWSTDEFTGMEIWNHMSEWMEGLTDDNKYQRFLHPLKSSLKPPQETLNKWDELNKKRLVVGIGGSDCHAHEQVIMGVTVQIFPYKVAFRAIRTYLLLNEPISPENSISENANLLYSALKSGHAYFVNYYRGSGKGFRFWMENKTSTLGMGDRSKSEKYTVKVFSPLKRTIRLLKDGNLFHEVHDSDHMTVSVSEKGVYRVEVMFSETTGWIYSNPITLI